MDQEKRERKLINASGIGDSELVLSLISQGVNPDAKDLHGHTPLIWTSANGHYEVVKILVEIGRANIDIIGNYGMTALINSSINKEYKIVEFLIKNGADVEITDRNDNSFLENIEDEEIRRHMEELAKIYSRVNFKPAK